MNIRSLLFLTLLFIAIKSEGQNQYTLTGFIHDTTSNKLISEVHIINRSTEQGSTSNSKGYFEITAKSGDQILFHHISYEPLLFIVHDNSTLNINLKPMSHELNEIILQAKSWEQFKLEFVQTRFEKEKSSGLTIKGLKQYKGPPIGFKPSLGTALTNPISFLNHYYSKKAIEKRKTKRYQKIIKNKSYIDD